MDGELTTAERGVVLGVGAAQEQNKPTAGAPTNHVLWIALQRERRQASRREVSWARPAC